MKSAINRCLLASLAFLLPSLPAVEVWDKALAAPLVTIVDKAKPSPTGDPHDYVSYARYYWPDPAKPDGLPFISRDGQHNLEQVAAGDRYKIDRLVDNVTALANGWERHQRADCARRAGDWLRAWFITPSTRMKPALDYAQVRLGHSKNRGNAAGVIDTRELAALVAVIPSLRGSPAFSADEEKTIQAWFSEYYQWLQTAPSGRAEYAAKNNHGSWYLVQAVGILQYLGRTDEARALCDENKARIAAQFAADGSQPDEIRRADGLHYSHFNLQAHLRLALKARALGVELWNYTAPNGASLKKGVDYVRPYNAAPATWPHGQKEVKEPGFMDDILALAEQLDATVP